MNTPDNELVDKYGCADNKAKLLKKQLDTSRYKNNIKKALTFGLIAATIAGTGASIGNSLGLIDLMPSNHMQIDKEAVKPTTVPEAIASIEMATTMKVDYTLGWSTGKVYADGVEVGILKSKVINIMDAVQLQTINGEGISTSKQHISLMGKFSVHESTGDETSLKGKFSLTSHILERDNSEGKKLNTAKTTVFSLYTKGEILDSEGNVIYEITKEPFGKTFTIKKVGESSEISNSDALVLAGTLVMKANNSSSSSSSSNNSNSK